MENKKNTENGSSVDNNANVPSKKKCGIIMPIADTVGYPPNHWQDVLNILCEAVNKTDFEAKLVSDDTAIGLIHDRIVTNIYNNDIVICDVSSKNPNVMFELGMRLAFDKPTIIIKDEKTEYAFDTSGIEHIQYPISLRYHSIAEFQAKLIKSIIGTYEKSSADPNYSPFLKSFGRSLIPASIEKTEISESKYIIEVIDQLRKEMYLLRKGGNRYFDNFSHKTSDDNYSLDNQKIYIRTELDNDENLNRIKEINKFLAETDDAQKKDESLRFRSATLNEYFKSKK
ncbi:MAG: hypothetical protein ACK5LF_25515 [Bacteroides xylanisolvens]